MLRVGARPLSQEERGDPMMPLLVVPGADFPWWAPLATGAMGVVLLVIVIVQTIRYFKDHRDQ